MKRLDIIVKTDKIDDVIKAIKKVGVGGVSTLQIKGQGREDPPIVGSNYTRGMIITIVEDSKVNSILTAVGNVACTKTKGDGKVFISNVEEVMDICTKECGHTLL
jgi:nitrogen regulatory protein P-II 1